jgi:hypothetical protein
MPDWNSHTNPDTDAHTHTYTYTYPDAYPYTNTYADCNAYTYTHTGADHAARAWLQSAWPANGGPLLEWADLGFHRHLSQRHVDCHRAEPGWFLYRSPQPQWEGNLYV